MSSLAAQPTAKSGRRQFAPYDVAFALAWEVHAPGLGGWTVNFDADDDGEEFVLIDPPLVYGNGFNVRPDGSGVVITSPIGTHLAASLREAMLLICPLNAEALAAVELLAAAPTLAV